MAITRRSSLGSAILGAIVLLLLLIVAAAVVIFGGLYPVAASSPHSAGIQWAIGEARDRAVERSASGLRAPQFSTADVREGGSHFKGMCQECHGGPGVEPEEFATAMNPKPPNLARATGDLSTSEVFWIAKNGLKMTGMPAFGKADEDEELWKVAAFVKSIQKVSAADYASLPNAHEHEEAAESGEMHGDKGHHSH
jgi:mono/diheme cytochrome c family protein